MLDRWGAWLLAGTVAIHVGTFAYFFATSLYLFPVEDMLDWIAAALTSDDLLEGAIAPHNGHRIVATRLLTVLCLERSGAELGSMIAVAVLGIGLAIALLVYDVWRFTRPRRLACLASLVIVLVSLRSYTLIAWVNPTYVHQALVLGFFSASIRFASDSIFEVSRSLPRWILALGLAVCASFSSGQGLLTWGALGWLAIRYRVGRLRFGLLLALAGGVGLFYFRGLGAVASAGADPALRDHFLLAIHYLGQPWVKVPALHPLGFSVGLIVIASSLYFIVRRGSLGAPPDRGSILALALVGLGLASAALTGWLRASEGVLAVTRYGIFTAVTEAALIALFAREFASYWRADRIRRRTMICAIAVALLLLPEQVAVGLQVQRDAERSSRAVTSIRSGDRSDAVLEVIYPNPDRARALLSVMEQHGVMR